MVGQSGYSATIGGTRYPYMPIRYPITIQAVKYISF